VNVLGYVEGNHLVVEGYFAGKAKAMDCLVEVFAADGAKLAEGRTDRSGLLKLELGPLKGKGDVKLLLHAGSGHQAEYTVKAEDLGGPSAPGAVPEASGSPPPKAEEEAAPAKPKAATAAPEKPESQGTAVVNPPTEGRQGAAPVASGEAPPSRVVVDPKLIGEELDRRLDAKLAPIVRTLEAQRKAMVEQQDKGPSVVEIFGGVGWIFGLVGVAAYFLSLKKRGNRVS
jgi:nickel transport protein